MRLSSSPRQTITVVSMPVARTSARWFGIASMIPSTARMNRITSQVSQGYSHMLNSSGLPVATSWRRMRSWEMAITRYTSSATAPELARRKAKTFSGAK
ncbi:hypothetical protein D9M68_573570 [compost metagenome]